MAMSETTMSDFAPDSSIVERVVPSPNHSERRDGARPDMILLHYTGMDSAAAALDRLCDPTAKVSSHYLVFEDGQVMQLVPETRRAHHAGVSFWAGDTDINSRSIGIEIVNPGHDLGYPDFPKRQIAALIVLCRGILTRQTIPHGHVLAHSDVAPTRKQDPGEKFPWQILSESGVGLWVKPAPLTANGDTLRALGEGDKGNAVADLQKELAEYGYGLPTTGSYDELTKAVVMAFQRHFRPALVDGIADASTRQTLRALLAAR
jgi:N-acetylmuramoyl-L-alanine amidase